MCFFLLCFFTVISVIAAWKVHNSDSVISEACVAESLLENKKGPASCAGPFVLL